MRHLFVIDPLEKLDPAMDTTLRIAFALHALGHESYACTPWELSWSKSDPTAMAYCQRIVYDRGPETAVLGGQQVHLPLSAFLTVHMRKDPPFDMDYITATWLLDTAPKSTRVYNSPEGLRSINEKAIILKYPEAVAPALISASPDQILDFIRAECNSDAILKPLTLYSGKGIQRLNLTTTSEDAVRTLLNLETAGVSQRLVQPFDPAIFNGEVRAFAINGEPLAWCLKKPAPGNFMANSSFGSTRHSYQPTDHEVALVKKISKDLLNQGIAIVGYDLIGGKISEINVTSPRLLTAPDDHTDYYQTIAEWLSSK